MINKVTLIGRLGGDPEVRTLENGTQVGRFSCATTDSYKDKEGNWQNTTEWHNVVVWRDLAERAKNILHKGCLVYVEGKISYRKYTDRDGVEKTVCDIVSGNFRLLEKQEHRQQADPGAEYQQAEKAAHSPMPEPEYGGDDLPF